MIRDASILSLALPHFDNVTEPKISSLASCKPWLIALPLSNVQMAQSQITEQLMSLNRFDIDALERLKIIEHLRETVNFIQGELAKKYQNKPIPFGVTEQVAWNKVRLLWQAMGEAYQHCLQACLDGSGEVAPHAALITQRCIRYTTLQMLEQLRAYHQLEGGIWPTLHAFIRHARAQGLADTPIKDSLNPRVETTTCSAAYAHALLLFLSNPYQLSARQLNLVDKWLDKWAERVPLLMAPPVLPDSVLLGADLASSDAPHVLKGNEALAEPIYLDTEHLQKGLRKRIKFLRKGGSPAELDIGEECTQPGCEVFLTGLYQHWCEGNSARACPRRATVANAEVAFGTELIYFFINGGKPFEQPAKQLSSSTKEAQDLLIFGYVRNPSETDFAAQPGYKSEDWRIEDESALGFGLIRAGSGSHISYNQLLAIRPADSPSFLLAIIRWLIFTHEGGFRIGTRTLPGNPIPVSARLFSINPADGNKYVAAFLLPEMPALKAPASLVLPLGWYHPGKTIEICPVDAAPDQPQTVKLQTLLEKGSDFERVAFVRA